MKKILILLTLAICLMPVSGWATTWYACGTTPTLSHVSGTTVSDVLNDAATCDGNWLNWAENPHGGDIIEANAVTGIIVDVDPAGTHDGTKVHLKTLSGGTFTITAAGTYTITADLTAGTTDCLTINGTANTIVATVLGNIIGSGTTTGADALVLGGSDLTATIGSSGTPVTISGGSVGYGVADGHSGSGKTTTVYADITGGSGANVYGYYSSASSGTINITGTINGGSTTNTTGLYKNSNATISINGSCIAAVASGCYNQGSSGSMTVKTCQGSTTNANSPGCYGYGQAITVTENIVNTDKSVGAIGSIVWSPTAATNYIYFIGDGTPTGYYLTSNVAGGAHPAIADVKLGTEYGWDGADHYTGTLAASGGGAFAW